MRAIVAALVLSALASGTASAATPDSSLALADTAIATVPQRDAFDLLNEHLLHRRVEPELGGTLRTGIEWAILPTLSYNPVYGLALGAMVSGAGRRSAESPRYSQISVSANFSTSGQIQLQARGEVFSPGGNNLLKADVRYLDTERSTWGLGPVMPDQQEYPMELKLTRFYATVYQRAGGAAFVGLGYHHDEFTDIVDRRAQAGETTPFTAYSGGAPSHATASGLSLNVLGDTRDNLVNPSAGYYLSMSMRTFAENMGSDTNWQELWAEMRLYPHVPGGSRNVLGFWFYNWLTFGHPPYLDLPSCGWDTYGRGARGYLQGRIRGTDQLYFEAEYRMALSRDGLWGAVGFLNGTTTVNPNTGLFASADVGGGGGLRIKFNKHTNTNLSVDLGWGDGGPMVFLGMSEVF